MEGTSFRKKKKENCRIAGTKVSYHNVQLITSTGVPSLDSHLGGGVSLGTVLLIEEDNYNTYSKILLKYFISKGITNEHSIILASANDDPEKLLKEIPSVVEQKPKQQTLPDVDDLKIAWRYKDQRPTSQDDLAEYTNHFDLSKRMSADKIKAADVCTWNICEHLSNEDEKNHFLSEPYLSLSKKISKTLEEYQATGRKNNKVLRIAISSMASPLWTVGDNRNFEERNILRFLFVLRSLLRPYFAVALITLPALLHQNAKLREKVRQASDFVVRLEAFTGSKKTKNSFLRDYDGLFHIVKVPVLNTFAYQIPPRDLAFRLHRKYFHIEQLHLPPDVEDPAAGDQTMPMCGGPSKLLDF